MKAFHFILTTGERGTLAGCPDDMTLDEALAALNFQFTGRIESVEESTRRWLDPEEWGRQVDERHFSGRRPRLSDAHAEAPEPMLIVQRLQNIRKREKARFHADR